MKYKLIFVMSDKYITSSLNPLIKLSTSSKSTKSKDILPGNILQLITKIVPMSRKKCISCALKRGIPCPLELEGRSVETKTTAGSEFPKWGKRSVEQILASTERNISESLSGIQVGKLTIWVKSFEIEKS